MQAAKIPIMLAAITMPGRHNPFDRWTSSRAKAGESAGQIAGMPNSSRPQDNPMRASTPTTITIDETPNIAYAIELALRLIDAIVVSVFKTQPARAS
jgi:hypothetical protein